MAERERIRVLMVEDTPADAELILRELARAGFDVEHERVEDGAALRAALTREWNIILCDYTLPQLDAPTALRIVREIDLDIPVIVISGTVGEEIAVQVMRFGASDYMLKDNLRRLGPAVTRELRESRVRKERRRLDDARRAAEGSFRLIIERSPELVVVHRDGRVVYANPTALARLGYRSAAELEGRPLDVIVGHAGPGGQREQSWLRSDGSSLTVEVERQTTTFDGEKAVVDVARDVTERNELTTAMMEVDRMAAIGVLAAGVAHEINNPLAYVLANLEYVSGAFDEIMVARPDPRFDDVRQALADMDHGAKRVRDIVQDIRTFSRVSDARRTHVDVRHVLDSSVRMASVQIRPRAKLVRRYEDVPPVLAIESRLGQVFLNLVTNAAQAVPEGKSETNRITLETRFEGGKVVVSVSDTGVGIPTDALPRLFQPFFTTKPTGHGTGLGLAISRRIVETLGGTIEVVSSPTDGTTFTVRLPPAIESRAAAAPLASASMAPPRRGRILVVDDEPALGVALRRLLLADHDVEVVTSAAAASQRVASGEHYDVILCDLLMPGMSGMELHAELVKEMPDLAGRMVFLTGAVSTPRARGFLDTIPNARLEKPVRAEDLRTTIAGMLAH